MQIWKQTANEINGKEIAEKKFWATAIELLDRNPLFDVFSEGEEITESIINNDYIFKRGSNFYAVIEDDWEMMIYFEVMKDTLKPFVYAYVDTYLSTRYSKFEKRNLKRKTRDYFQEKTLYCWVSWTEKIDVRPVIINL
jgi:hypothetical protein